MIYLLTKPPAARAAVAALSTAACSLGVAERIGLAGFEEAKRVAVAQKWPNTLPIDEFLARAGRLSVPTEGEEAKRTAVLLDVRAPCEYARGHIPGAISLPLFTDEERAVVGTLYKREGHDVAVRKGLKLVSAKWPTLLDGVAELEAEDADLYVYCFRGGMRSGGMAWLLSQALPGRVHTLSGGYKRFRNWAIERWEDARPVVVLGGRTGSGKTDVLLAMRDALGAQVLDLEGDAHHRGSIFGSLGRPPQPTNEHYENLLALQWANFSPQRPVFVEDESKAVGSCGVPPGLWQMMRGDNGRSMRLDVPHEARINRLVGEYGVYPPEDLAACVRGLRKRLGGAKCDSLAAALEQQPPALAEVADALLVHYYDGMYDHQMKNRGGHDLVIEAESGDALTNAQLVLDAAASFEWVGENDEAGAPSPTGAA